MATADGGFSGAARLQPECQKLGPDQAQPVLGCETPRLTGSLLPIGAADWGKSKSERDGRGQQSVQLDHGNPRVDLFKLFYTNRGARVVTTFLAVTASPQSGFTHGGDAESAGRRRSASAWSCRHAAGGGSGDGVSGCRAMLRGRGCQLARRLAARARWLRLHHSRRDRTCPRQGRVGPR
jgi:hypothetical protein